LSARPLFFESSYLLFFCDQQPTLWGSVVIGLVAIKDNVHPMRSERARDVSFVVMLIQRFV
jgi:diadenosine tetraphosphate (Ap4A) HIT family hydrolase